MLYIDLIKNNLKHLSLQTALLEACNWDEDTLHEKLQFVQSFLNEWNPPEWCKNWEDAKENMEAKLDKSFHDQFGYYNNPFLDIIIDVIELHRSEILQHFSMGEN